MKSMIFEVLTFDGLHWPLLTIDDILKQIQPLVIKVKQS
jgi:hypothetical protein